jgi:hypothetical protein
MSSKATRAFLCALSFGAGFGELAYSLNEFLEL